MKPVAVIFHGGIGGGAVADMVADCQLAIAGDTIDRIQQTGAFDDIILITERNVNMPNVTIERSRRPFHFGAELKRAIERHRIAAPVYIGSGSVPLLKTGGLKSIGETIASRRDTVITNNTFSSDMVAFTPGTSIGKIELPPTDNRLAQALISQAGLRPITLPRTASHQFDVDTPTDLAILKLHRGAGKNSRRYLESIDIDTTRLQRAIDMFNDINAQVTVAGRVGSHVWSQLERKTSCRVRLLAEERSLNADERSRRGEVCTILGFYLEQVGMDRFFQTLAQMGHAAFIDTRVIFTHFRLNPSIDDRFYSDLGQYQKIRDSFVREFTRQAVEAPMPVILGGHSLVSGGMLAMIEIARHRNRQAVDTERMVK